MRDLEYPIVLTRGVPVAIAPAALDIGNADVLRMALLRAAAGGHATLVADLSGTDLCDSAGLTVLVRAHRHAVAEGGELRLVATTPAVMRILKVTGVDQVIRIFASVDAAVDETPAVAIEPGSTACRAATRMRRRSGM